METNDLFVSVPMMETDRLILRQLTNDDAADYLDIFSNEEVTRHYDVDIMTRIEEAEALIDRHNGHYQNQVSIRYVLQLKDSRKVIGTFGLYDFKDRESVEIGFDLNREYWKQGYMSEAIRRVIEFSFQELGVGAVFGGFLKPNTASENLLKRLGFTRDKVLDNIEIKPGVFETVYFYKLTRSGEAA